MKLKMYRFEVCSLIFVSCADKQAQKCFFDSMEN